MSVTDRSVIPAVHIRTVHAHEPVPSVTLAQAANTRPLSRWKTDERR